MATPVTLQIYTPTGVFWDQKVTIVTVKTTEGYIGLQYNKSPFLAALDIAEVHINESSTPHHKVCAIAGGIVDARRDKIIIITDAIEFKENIDLSRAKRAKQIAEKQLKTNESDAERMRVQMALKKAINRIEVKNS